MRLLLILLGSLLLHGEVHASLPAPPRPAVISKYVDAVFTTVESNLAAADAGTAAPCDPEHSESEAAGALRTILFDVGQALREPERDLERTACFQSDAEALEQYLRQIIDMLLSSAQACTTKAEAAYTAQVKLVWNFLYQLRRLGLDPTVRTIVEGQEVEPLPSSPPPSPLPPPTADDARCPYHSAYASPPLFPGLGCHLPLPSSASQRLIDEANFTEQILLKLGFPTGLAFGLPALHQTFSDIWNDTALFVLSVSVLRPPAPLLIPTLMFIPSTTAINAGESGCLDWPSDVSGTVTAENVPLQNYFPLVLTRELAEVVQFLRERERPEWFEYVEALRREQEASSSQEIPLSFYDDLRKENRVHLGIESFSILTIREPQRKMGELANFLHQKTRDFAGFATNVSATTWPPPDSPLPPLRAFAKDYATFLSRMCINRGCDANLLRTVELSLRHECFSSFLTHLFFKANPDVATLPPCRILYTE